MTGLYSTKPLREMTVDERRQYKRASEARSKARNYRPAQQAKPTIATKPVAEMTKMEFNRYKNESKRRKRSERQNASSGVQYIETRAEREERMKREAEAAANVQSSSSSSESDKQPIKKRRLGRPERSEAARVEVVSSESEQSEVDDDEVSVLIKPRSIAPSSNMTFTTPRKKKLTAAEKQELKESMLRSAEADRSAMEQFKANSSAIRDTSKTLRENSRTLRDNSKTLRDISSNTARIRDETKQREEYYRSVILEEDSDESEDESEDGTKPPSSNFSFGGNGHHTRRDDDTPEQRVGQIYVTRTMKDSYDRATTSNGQYDIDLWRTHVAAHQLVYDSGGGWSNTITKLAWMVADRRPGEEIQYYDEMRNFSQGPDAPPQICEVVRAAATKATITGPSGPYEVIFLLFNAACSPHPMEDNSLLKLDLFRDAGGSACSTLPQQGGYCGLWVDEGKTFLPFQVNINKDYGIAREIFFNISKPTLEEIQTLPNYDLNNRDHWSPQYFRYDAMGNKVTRDGKPLEE